MKATQPGPSTAQRAVVGVVLAVLAVAACYPLALAVIALASPQPAYVGQGQLASCPPTPNCVSSLTADENAYIEPLTYNGPAELAQSVLVLTLEELPRTLVVQAEDGYVRAESRSPTLRFIDDMEFVFVPEDGIIHVRAAARLGNSDLGMNRARVEALRARFNAQLTQAVS